MSSKNLNSKSRRLRIINTGKSLGKGNLPGQDGRAYEDYTLDGKVYRVTFPSWLQGGTVEVLDFNPENYKGE